MRCLADVSGVCSGKEDVVTAEGHNRDSKTVVRGCRNQILCETRGENVRGNEHTAVRLFICDITQGTDETPRKRGTAVKWPCKRCLEATVCMGGLRCCELSNENGKEERKRTLQRDNGNRRK